MLNRPKHSDREKSFTLLNPIIQCKKSYTLYCGEEKKEDKEKVEEIQMKRGGVRVIGEE